MNRAEYWVECVESSFSEHGITASKEQIECVAGDVEVSHENQGMAFGDDVASRNFHEGRESEIAALKTELRAEQDKLMCQECKGRGYIVCMGPVHSAESVCFTCKGNGRV